MLGVFPIVITLIGSFFFETKAGMGSNLLALQFFGFQELLTRAGVEDRVISEIIIIILLFSIPIGYFLLLSYQVIDARKRCRKFNEHMDKTGHQLVRLTRNKKIIFGVIAAAPLILPPLFALINYFENVILN